MKKEKCEICNMPTGRAGRADDSIICEKCDKIICKDCIGKEHEFGVVVCTECLKETKSNMRTKKEIKNELERVRKEKEFATGDERISLASRYWTLRWVLSEEESNEENKTTKIKP
jgi:hypothetical protein